MMSVEDKGEESREEERTGEAVMTVGDCRTEESTGTSLRRGVSVRMPSTDTYRIIYTVHKNTQLNSINKTTDTKAENKTFTHKINQCLTFQSW